ncbi:ABC transporter ATP-binding protein [Achromobacter animicus]|uniref:ABC transporter ATP-binding protein n=1 Tax=Achromobacter animicus TaxID=1389935 RepID=UPI0028AE5F7A|nr:ABC transporter ATP-binding protein [Achromobacter animicus]
MPVFENLSLVIPEGKNVAILGNNGVGKSTLLRLLGGIDIPDSGRIYTNKSISWPVGLSGGFQGSMTGRENVKFVARVYGAEGQRMTEVVREVEEFAEIGKYFDQPVKQYSSGMRARLAFGLSLAFDFDYYLIDEAMSVGDAHFREKATAAFQDRIDKANVLLISHGMGQVRKICNHVLVLKKGAIEQYEDVEAGITAYQRG